MKDEQQINKTSEDDHRPGFIYYLFPMAFSGGTIKIRSVCAMNSLLYSQIYVSLFVGGRNLLTIYQSILWWNITYIHTVISIVSSTNYSSTNTTATVHGVLFLSIGIASNQRRTQRERTDMHSASVLRVTHIFGNKPLPLASFWCKRASCRLGVVLYIYIVVSIDVLQFIMVLLC